MPVLVAYWIPDRGCSDHKQGAPTAAAYRVWIGSLVARLGPTRAVVVLEPDALPADCFDAGRARLMAETVRRLSAAGQSVYLDAGHAAWKSTGDTAERLLAAGIDDAEGFAVNVSNRQTTAVSAAWGRELSDLVGHRPFVVDVSRNGIGPPPDRKDRDGEWCNPAHQALGDPADHPRRAARRRRAAVDQAAGGVGRDLRRRDVVLLLAPAGQGADREQSRRGSGRAPGRRRGGRAAVGRPTVSDPPDSWGSEPGGPSRCGTRHHRRHDVATEMAGWWGGRDGGAVPGPRPGRAGRRVRRAGALGGDHDDRVRAGTAGGRQRSGATQR